jgi:hypothetical protein
MMIKKIYDKRERSGIKNMGDSLTIQTPSNETDINRIVSRAMRTGILGNGGGSRQPMFGDFSSGDDFEALQMKIVQWNSGFMTLPASVRQALGNNPARLIDVMADPDNDAYASVAKSLRDLGLIPDKKPIATEKVAPVVPVEEAPEE